MKKSKWGMGFLVLVLCMMLVGCSSESGAEKDKAIHIGFNPGPYFDQFKLGIEPQLEEKGYTIQYTDFSDGIQPNVAIANEEIDANIFQHTIYMESINEEEGLDLVGVVHVPTPPMGLYSEAHDQLEGKKGMVVAMPSDPVNMTRALRILEDIGWIRLKEDLDPLRVTEQDIIENEYDLDIRPMDAAQGPRALEDVDYVAIQGNYAVASDIPLRSALAQEKMDLPYMNVVTVKEKNKQADFVQDLVAAYESEQFQEAILENEQFDGYTLPTYFKE